MRSTYIEEIIEHLIADMEAARAKFEKAQLSWDEAILNLKDDDYNQAENRIARSCAEETAAFDQAQRALRYIYYAHIDDHSTPPSALLEALRRELKMW